MLFTKKTKKAIGIAALTCFLSLPVSYTLDVSTASAAAFDKQNKIEQRHDRNDRWDKDDKDKNPPPPPPRHDRDDDRWDKDDGKDYDKGDIATAVVVGGVVGAIIANNT